MSESVHRFKSPVRIDFRVTAGRYLERYLAGLTAGEIFGRRCGSCNKVYVPPRPACPTCFVCPDEDVQVQETGTVTTFCVVSIPYEGQKLEIPYVGAMVLLDGADLPLFHVVGGIPADQVRMGTRVRAVWAPAKERRPTLESILYFEPSGEPDVEFDAIAMHL